MSVLLAVRPTGLDGVVWPVARLDSLICMTVTGLVFVTVLRGIEELIGLRVLTDVVFHYFAPLAAVVGWVLFGPRPAISRRTLALALIFPLAWVAYTLVRGEIVSWYPYPFINVAERGYARVAVTPPPWPLSSWLSALPTCWPTAGCPPRPTSAASSSNDGWPRPHCGVSCS